MYSVLTGLGYAVPDRVLTNVQLEQMVDTDNEWIVQRTGIRERRIADASTATSDLALAAARSALADAGVSAAEVDLIIVATVTPDYAFPATACLIQRELGAWNAAAFDLEAACTGFIYGLGIADQFIRAGTYRTILVIGAETLSRITDYTDRNTCVLFGDGAGAAVLRAGEEPGLLGLEIGADGRGGELLVLPAGGSRNPASRETVAARRHYIHMAGREVFKFAVKIMEESALRVLARAGLQPGEVDLIIPHQANARIIDSACKRLGIGRDRVYVNLDRYGNMSAASIPVALSEASARGKLKPGDYVLLVGFGGGLTWGAAVIKWNKEAKHD
ncbi:MAG: ketoacyl-ACP synthase III [Firmicutes bacterium]|nr:ketoacyl-ACP synthase III [Bacillota bacterium]HOB34861.1 beta-ketoacyl-ACP synthase III [Bacillota bacterium]HPZ90395.1 beta-ketoacyl-ACP synthase III [Bacillota bacterium]HQE02493.1 beta-ketoacyl-ACP synthase III [Bacillota bacterium]